MNELALFAGDGGGILGGRLLGWTCVGAIELDEYRRRVLMARQDDGCLEPFPVWDDVRTFDGEPWCGLVDVLTAGFPCQDVTIAGKGGGVANGARSGLWREVARIGRQVRAPYVLLENGPLLTSRGLDLVLGDLASMGYDAEWGMFSAAGVGAPHRRKRIWVLAYSPGILRERLQVQPELRPQVQRAQEGHAPEPPPLCSWSRGSGALVHFPRMDDGVANRLDAVAATGDGQLPAVVVEAWTVLSGRICL